MSTEVYLGYPPPNVRAWIEKKYRKTVITFDDGSTEEYDWSGDVTQQTLIDAGIYDGSYGWLKNPSSIQFGTTVTTVGNDSDYTFNTCNSLASVSMPNVTSVGDRAFYSCEAITSVSMPNVTSIGEQAFYGCYSLASVSMPNVMSIGDEALWNIFPYVEFKNQTTSTISEWFGNHKFGAGWGQVTVTCSNGRVYAEWDYNENTWTITITSSQQ